MVVPGPVVAETCLRLTWARKSKWQLRRLPESRCWYRQPITKDLELGIEISSGGWPSQNRSGALSCFRVDSGFHSSRSRSS